MKIGDVVMFNGVKATVNATDGDKLELAWFVGAKLNKAWVGLDIVKG